ncbi:hypothetical protein [uncultured Methanosphaera sp.]|uniref:hypothetical protein n=1 Tax=uncultured Methanosphaera sp. TaxID=262501 RepID=UPI002804D049|nr:hypothetical protein [uncultured Methanosphaera sp.]
MLLNKQNTLTYRKITEKSTLKSLTSDRWEEKVELSDKLMNNIQKSTRIYNICNKITSKNSRIYNNK